MLSDHERAALDALRYARECGEKLHGCRNVDIAIAIALRDHLPDDKEPVTLEWALSSVQSDRNCGPYCGGVQLWSGPNSWAAVPLDATRRDFRDLCRIMGIELKEQA